MTQEQANSLTISSALAAQRETDRISFAALFKDAGVADKSLSDLVEMANDTPFLYDDLTAMSKTLATYGYGADSILPVLQTVGDTGAALGMSTSDRDMESVRGGYSGALNDAQKYAAYAAEQQNAEASLARETRAAQFAKVAGAEKRQAETALGKLNTALDAAEKSMYDRAKPSAPFSISGTAGSEASFHSFMSLPFFQTGIKYPVPPLALKPAAGLVFFGGGIETTSLYGFRENTLTLVHFRPMLKAHQRVKSMLICLISVYFRKPSTPAARSRPLSLYPPVSHSGAKPV